MAWLRETLRSVAHYLHTRGPHFILPILTVLAFQVDVFGLGAATQTQSENTIVRLAAPFYDAAQQKSVVAVLIDKPYVERAPNGTGGSPIPYRKFTAIIDQLLPLDPAAIYIGAVFELQPTRARRRGRRCYENGPRHKMPHR